MNETTIDGDGRIALPPRVARRIGTRPLTPVSFSGRHLLLTAADEGEALVLAGVLGDLAVADLLSFLNMFRRTGILHFDLEAGTKEVYFQQGEIVFATTTLPDEDLGEVLFALGKIEREDLQKARQLVSRRNPLGKILVDRALVCSRDLWLATRNQVEGIVYDLFTHAGGSFSFVARALEDEEIVRLSMNTQNLIMESLRRVDEKELFLRRIGSLDDRPAAAEEAPEGLSSAEERLLKMVRRGTPTARELLRQSGMGEFEALRLLHRLVEKKAVRMEEAPADVAAGDLGEILAIYNGALVVLYRAVGEKFAGFDREIKLFLRDLPQPFSYVFRGVEPRRDGSLAAGGILTNLGGLEEGDKKKLLADALNELIYMECIIARRELGTAGSADLIQRVQKISSRVKDLVGR